MQYCNIAAESWQNKKFIITLPSNKQKPMNTEKQIQLAAAAFAERWLDKGDEKSAESTLLGANNNY